MNILVIGSGGREHALAWKLKQSPRCSTLYCAPGNAGTGQVAENIDINAGDIAQLAEFTAKNSVDLTVVGPDDTLAAGIVDEFSARGLRIFGPTRDAARLESSKIFAKEFMQKHGIPTARYARFEEVDQAVAALSEFSLPVVVKADGLALGKGVIIAHTLTEAEAAIHAMLEEVRFGDAGKRILIEEFLQGEECSIHAIFDDHGYLLFPPAQDHKQAYDGDQGPNTGGMGTFSPPPLVDEKMLQTIDGKIMQPFLQGIKADKISFRGMLFPGLMLTADGPKVLEFNCRFGDPETQVLLPRLKSDLVELLDAAIDNQLATLEVAWDPRPAVCVVMASGGYPSHYQKGVTIQGVEAAESDGAIVFHAGTKYEDRLITSGGRVLGVTAMANSLPEATAAAYRAVDQIHFENAHFRKDIAVKGIAITH